MIYLVYTLHVLVCVFLILVVLLQQGKGADLSVFGGGSTQTAFGARGATTFLHKLTVASFVIFVLTTLAIGIHFGGAKSVLSGASGKPVAGKSTAAGKAPAAPAAPASRQGTAPATPNPAAAAPPAQSKAPAAAPGTPSTPSKTPPAPPAPNPAPAH